MRTLFNYALLPLAAALMVAGCASSSSFAPRSAPEAPAVFKEAAGRFVDKGPAEAQVRGQWWSVFADPVLDDLVRRAVSGNTSLQTSAARLAEARALLRHADATRLPQIGLSAGVNRATALGAQPGQAQTLGNLSATAAWEPDVFGRLRGASDAATLDAQARAALLESTRLLVQSEVARVYFGLRGLDAERVLVRDSVAAYRETLRLTERRYHAGDVAELDLARVQAEVAATSSQALALDRDRARHEHALAVLLGEMSSGFTLAETQQQAVLPTVPAGVPSTVLARRADVSAAQWALRAAEVRAGVARAAWFPDIALTAQGGTASADLGDLFKWSARAWGIGALLSLPLFDGGRREAGVESANAMWDAAAASYREQILGAVRDVEDQLSALHLLAQQADSQARAVDASTRATRLSDSRYRNGLVSQLELLDARRSELANRRVAAQVQTARYDATVSLIRALGGGWDNGAAGAAVVEPAPGRG